MIKVLSRAAAPLLLAALLSPAAQAQPRVDCDGFANDMVATGQRGMQARCQDFNGFNMNWADHRNWCQTRNAFRVQAELSRWRDSLDRCLSSQPPVVTPPPPPPRPVQPPPHSRPGSIRWIPGNGQACEAVCRQAGMHGLRSGSHITRHGDTGDDYFVCAGDASGWRPGFNLQPSWADTCIVAYGGREIRTERYTCACN